MRIPTLAFDDPNFPGHADEIGVQAMGPVVSVGLNPEVFSGLMEPSGATNDVAMGLLDIYLIYAVGASVVVMACLFLRLLSGASPWMLLRTRFYEIVPIRLIVRLTHLCLWGLAIASLLIALAQGWAYFYREQQQHLEAAVGAGVAWLSIVTITWVFYFLFVQIQNNSPPPVSVRRVTLGNRLDAHKLHQIGRQQFPQMVEFGFTGGLLVRRLLVAFVMALVAVAITAATEWGSESGLLGNCLNLIAQIRQTTSSIPASWQFVAGLSCGLAMILMFSNNLSYTLVSFPRSLLLLSLLAAGLFTGAAGSSLTAPNSGHAMAKVVASHR